MPLETANLENLKIRRAQLTAQLATVKHAKASFKSADDRALLLYQTSLNARVHEHIIISKIIKQYGKYTGKPIPEA